MSAVRLWVAPLRRLTFDEAYYACASQWSMPWPIDDHPPLLGLILSLASLTSSGENSGGGPTLVYLGEISYSIYMVCIPWKLLFVNVVSTLFGFDKAHLPLPVWIIFLLSVIPLAAASNHLIERPARGVMRRWAEGKAATVAGVA